MGSRSLLSARNLWLKELLDELHLLTGIQSPRYAVPSGLIFAGGIVSEGISHFTSSELRLNLETAIQSRRIQFYNATQTYKNLNWMPEMHCIAAIKRAIQWHQGNLPSSDLLSPSASSESLIELKT
ncbi:MAG: hypothetical protein V4507_13685 [Verrucomicrobiota bacterium]